MDQFLKKKKKKNSNSSYSPIRTEIRKYVRIHHTHLSSFLSHSIDIQLKEKKNRPRRPAHSGTQSNV